MEVIVGLGQVSQGYVGMSADLISLDLSSYICDLF